MNDVALAIGLALVNGQQPVDIIFAAARCVDQSTLGESPLMCSYRCYRADPSRIDLLLEKVWKVCLSVPGHPSGETIPNPILTIDFLRVQHLIFV